MTAPFARMVYTYAHIIVLCAFDDDTEFYLMSRYQRGRGPWTDTLRVSNDLSARTQVQL